MTRLSPPPTQAVPGGLTSSLLGAFAIMCNPHRSHKLNNSQLNTLIDADPPPQAVPGGLTSSMVDDVFFVLRKSGVRALASGSVQCSAALLAELNNVLANAFRWVGEKPEKP